MAFPSRSRSRGRRTRTPPSRSASPRRSISPRPMSRSRSHSPAPTPRGGRPNGFRARSFSGERIPVRRSRSFSRSPPPRGGSPQRNTKIVVEKLTKNVNENHLREIFGAYGPVRDVDMPMNRQCECELLVVTAETPAHIPQS